MGKKGKCPEFENHERWLVSYADMVTLLFAVFVVLFALKEGGEPQVQKAAGSMQESFNKPLEDIPMDRRGGPTEQGFGIFEHFRGNRIRPPMTHKFPSVKQKIRTIDAEMNLVENSITYRLYGPNKFRDNDQKGNERIVRVERTPSGFKLRLMGRHFFKDGSYKIRKKAAKQLDVVAKILKELSRPIMVEGHDDSVKQGKYGPWEMSALRSSSVARHIIVHNHFPQKLISVAGYGDIQPVSHNGEEAGRRLNRRVELHVRYDDE